MTTLSKTQIEILKAIKWKIKNFGYPPSIRELCVLTQKKSTSTIHFHLNKLEKLGVIKRNSEKPRSIEILLEDKFIDVPGLNQEIIKLPLINIDKKDVELKNIIEEDISLPADLIKDKNNFILKVKDDSLIEMGVLKGDYVIVDRVKKVKNEMIVILKLKNNHILIGQYVKKENLIEIKTKNKSNQTVLLYEKDFDVIGQIIGNFSVIK